MDKACEQYQQNHKVAQVVCKGKDGITFTSPTELSIYPYPNQTITYVTVQEQLPTLWDHYHADAGAITLTAIALLLILCWCYMFRFSFRIDLTKAQFAFDQEKRKDEYRETWLKAKYQDWPKGVAVDDEETDGIGEDVC